MFSQYGEDEQLLKVFGDRKGRLLDIGSWHPIDKSNSRALIERGWEAVLVEFSPYAVRELVKEYGGASCPPVEVLQAAISVTDRVMRKFLITDDAVSTDNADVGGTWKDAGGYYGSMWVPQITLETLLTQFGGGFDFVSIDTEGTSADLAIHYLQNFEGPEAMIVEHDGRIDEIMHTAREKGYYERLRNGTNLMLVKL